MLQLAGIDVRAVSIGGVETCIDLPGLRLAFDLGRAPDFCIARQRVLFTHAHVDHMSGAVWHCATRKLRGLPPPTYVVGREDAAAFRDLFAVWRRLDRSELPHELVELGPGEEYDLGQGRVARPFRSPHRAPCQGYEVLERRKKLRPEHRALDGREIERRRAAGEELFELVEIPHLAFTGDTRIDVLEREPQLLRVRLLILECTFLGPEMDVAHARETGHVHLDEIAERAALFENEALLLTHFSPRYAPDFVRAEVRRRLPPALLDRVTLLLPD